MHCEQQVRPRLDDPLDSRLARALHYHFVESGRRKPGYPLYLLNVESTAMNVKQQPAVATWLETELTVERLVTAIREMHPDQRATFCLHDIDAYTLNEISELLNVPVGMLIFRLHMARAYLREKLMQPSGENHRDV